MLDPVMSKHHKSDDGKKFLKFAEKLSTCIPIHLVWKLENLNLENVVFDWALEEKRAQLVVSILDIFDKTLLIDLQFREGDEKKRIHWAHNL